MFHMILYSALCVFVLIGMVASLYWGMMRLLRPRKRGRFVVVIPPVAQESDVASLLCAARLRLGLMADLSHAEVLALDCGMTDPCRRQCEALCRALGNTLLLRPEELLETLTQHELSEF